MLNVKDLTARFSKDFAIDRVSLSVRPGELVAMIGPNGSGKSSLLRLIAGLEAPQAGVIAWSEETWTRDRKVVVAPGQRKVSILFQEGVLFPHLSVHDNVALGIADDVPAAERSARAKAAIASARLAHLGQQAIHSLSGGEHQRVALARAVVQRPRVILLDEPFHSLDGTVKRSILSELRRTVKDQAIAALFVTHDLDEAWALSDRAVLLRGGAVVQEATMEELYRQPRNAWAATFLGEVEHMDVKLAREWGVALPESVDAAAVAFRPEDLHLSPVDQETPNDLTLAQVRGRGAFEQWEVRLPDDSTVQARVSVGLGFSPGQRVRARIARTLPAQAAEESAS